ncbi:unnamed protein product, partial [Rotaria sp. Silwood2]
LLLDMSSCALCERNLKLTLMKLNETRKRPDSYRNEIYSDVYVKRYQIQLLTSILSNKQKFKILLNGS